MIAKVLQALYFQGLQDFFVDILYLFVQNE